MSEARAAIDGANGTKLLDQTLAVDFAFVRPPPGKTGGASGSGAGGAARGGRKSGGGGGRARSRSPGEENRVEEEA